MATLNNILQSVNPLKIIGNSVLDISNIQFDSRKVSSGSLFVAIPGTQSDGHDFIPKSIELGAIAIICERLPNNPNTGVVWVQVENAAETLGIVASNFFGHPSDKLKLVGVTDQWQNNHGNIAVSFVSFFGL